MKVMLAQDKIQFSLESRKDDQLDYEEFLKQKDYVLESSGFDVDKSELNPMLFEFQKDIVRWALKKGKACIFCRVWIGEKSDAAFVGLSGS